MAGNRTEVTSTATVMDLPVLSVGGVEVKLSTYENAQIIMEGGQVRVSLENYSGDLLFMTSVSVQNLALPVARPQVPASNGTSSGRPHDSLHRSRWCAPQPC